MKKKVGLASPLLLASMSKPMARLWKMRVAPADPLEQARRRALGIGTEKLYPARSGFGRILAKQRSGE